MKEYINIDGDVYVVIDEINYNNRFYNILCNVNDKTSFVVLRKENNKLTNLKEINEYESVMEIYLNNN